MAYINNIQNMRSHLFVYKVWKYSLFNYICKKHLMEQ